jgi:seryl-tRNA synthetase
MRTRGEKPTFDFDTVDHVTLMQKHDMIDIERGVG